MNLRKTIKKLIPDYFLLAYRKHRINIYRKMSHQKSVKDVFTEVYNKNMWQGDGGTFHSGSGSNNDLADKYSAEVKKIIVDKNIKRMIDLGCGNFNVSKRIVNDNLYYIGVDVVEKLINFNNENYGKENIRFLCGDIIEDELPDADLCIIRQVLQHLSNSQISTILEKVKKYKYVLITEHYPSSKTRKIIPNKDKPHGADVRIYDNSAVYLTKYPFNIGDLTLVSEIKLNEYLVNYGEMLRTFLMENN